MSMYKTGKNHALKCNNEMKNYNVYLGTIHLVHTQHFPKN